jgi:uncharacterized RDD family membrane protein YckC
MTIDVADGAPERIDQPIYARFMARLRALYIDAIIMMVVAFGVLFVAVMLRSDNIARFLGFTVVAAWLLYEPLLVSFAGGTIGHRRTNLRVVDDRTHGNVGLLKAIVRTVIKGVLGWVSFVTMLTTRRSQAIHDLLTGSTMQIRNPALAGPKLYIRERQDLAASTLPSRTRRVLVIGAYVVATSAVCFGLLLLLAQQGLLSDRCLSANRCSIREEVLSSVVALGWLAICLLWLALGWRGRLPGASSRLRD